MQDLIPPILCNFSTKPKILYCADKPNSNLDIKGSQYRRYLSQFEIDIGYTQKDLAGDFYWKEMIQKEYYDLIWHLHEDIPTIEFITQQKKARTQVLLTQNRFISVENIRSEIKKYAEYNLISVNNPQTYDNFLASGFKNIYKTYDGVDLYVFGPDTPIQKRKFKVLFYSSNMTLDHTIWQEVKNLLDYRTDIEFININKRISDEEMNDIYNECQVFVSLSSSEDNPCALLKAAACGCVPIVTKVGYCDFFKNVFIIERNAEDCIKKIKLLKDKSELLVKMSRGISKEVLPWHDKIMAQHWGFFIQQALMHKKGIYLV